MTLLQKVINKFRGLHYPQEYLCLAPGAFDHPLHAYLLDEQLRATDITHHHAFVGYHPLILAIPSRFGHGCTNIDIRFADRLLQPNEVLQEKDAIAWLRLKKIEVPGFKHAFASFYEGIQGTHNFIPPIRQQMVNLYNTRYNRQKGNVYLPANLYTQVQIAYSLPRNISLVTVGQTTLFNLFPTDLHGAVDDEYYIISLRHAGKACRQVEESGDILLTQVDPLFYKTVYSLGKNHMQDLKPAGSFPFMDQRSAMLQLPLPMSALFYRELKLLDSGVYGIHKLMRFKLLNSHRMADQNGSLSHIHNTYATWRYNKGLRGNFLIR